MIFIWDHHLKNKNAGGRWEGGSGWGTHVNPWLFHFNVWQNPPQIKKKKRIKTLNCATSQNTLKAYFWLLRRASLYRSELPQKYTLLREASVYTSADRCLEQSSVPCEPKGLPQLMGLLWSRGSCSSYTDHIAWKKWAEPIIFIFWEFRNRKLSDWNKLAEMHNIKRRGVETVLLGLLQVKDRA